MAENNSSIERTDAVTRPEGKTVGGRRRRSFVATAGDKTPPGPPTPPEDEEDIPVLTEIVVAEPAPPEPPAVRDDEALLAIIASDLVRSLEQQLAIELPTLIEAALINEQMELRSGISSTMSMALHDFLARRQQLSLPFEEPNPDD